MGKANKLQVATPSEIPSESPEQRKWVENPKYFRPVFLSEEVFEALIALIEYEWYSEYVDFLESKSEVQASHIFASKLIVDDWLMCQLEHSFSLKEVYGCLLGLACFFRPLVFA